MKNRIPILDAGHGGMIDGVYSTGNKKRYLFINHDDYEVFEGIINREIGRKLADRLDESNIPFYSGNINDNNDMKLSLRTDKANKIYEKDNRTYFLSIHNNTATDSTVGEGTNAHGTEIWTSQGQTKSDELVPFFYNTFPSFFPFRTYRKDWEGGDLDKESDFWVLRKTLCPSLLIEVGFFDNYNEVKELLTSNEGLERIVNWLFYSIKIIYETDI